MKIVTYERIVFDARERTIRDSFPKDEWKKIMDDHRKGREINLLIAKCKVDQKIYHVEYLLKDHADHVRLKRIIFPNGGEIDIEIRKMNLDSLFALGIRRVSTLQLILNNARASCDEVYRTKHYDEIDKGISIDTISDESEGTNEGTGVSGAQEVDQGKGDSTADSGSRNWWEQM